MQLSIIDSWLNIAGVADGLIKKAPKELKPFKQLAQAVLARMEHERVIPVYKSYGFRMGILSWTRIKLLGYTALFFYAGICLARQYDLSALDE